MQSTHTLLRTSCHHQRPPPCIDVPEEVRAEEQEAPPAELPTRHQEAPPPPIHQRPEAQHQPELRRDPGMDDTNDSNLEPPESSSGTSGPGIFRAQVFAHVEQVLQ